MANSASVIRKKNRSRTTGSKLRWSRIDFAPPAAGHDAVASRACVYRKRVDLFIVLTLSATTVLLM